MIQHNESPLFSQRGKDIPNHIGMTSVKVVSVSDDRIVVEGLDALGDIFRAIFNPKYRPIN